MPKPAPKNTPPKQDDQKKKSVSPDLNLPLPNIEKTPSRQNDLSDSVIARQLSGGEVPLSHRRCPDGSFIVIDAAGRKLHFTPDQVAAVLSKK